jgi:hypothetical protein
MKSKLWLQMTISRLQNILIQISKFNLPMIKWSEQNHAKFYFDEWHMAEQLKGSVLFTLHPKQACNFKEPRSIATSGTSSRVCKNVTDGRSAERQLLAFQSKYITRAQPIRSNSASK